MTKEIYPDRRRPPATASSSSRQQEFTRPLALRFRAHLPRHDAGPCNTWAQMSLAITVRVVAFQYEDHMEELNSNIQEQT
jgi:hypothetical protein